MVVREALLALAEVLDEPWHELQHLVRTHRAATHGVIDDAMVHVEPPPVVFSWPVPHALHMYWWEVMVAPPAQPVVMPENLRFSTKRNRDFLGGSLGSRF